MDAETGLKQSWDGAIFASDVQRGKGQYSGQTIIGSSTAVPVLKQIVETTIVTFSHHVPHSFDGSHARNLTDLSFDYITICH